MLTPRKLTLTTISGNLTVSSSETNKYLNMQSNYDTRVIVGKEYDNCVMLYYRQPNIGVICLGAKSIIIQFNSEVVYVSMPVPIDGDLIV